MTYPRRFRYLHVSAPLVDIYNPATRQIETRVSPKSQHKSFASRRNQEKAAAREVESRLRKDALARRAAGDFTVSTAKIKRSALMINMLADRRLRQIEGGL